MFREGQQIGQYTLIGKLGKGGFGEVWLAEKRSQFITKRVAMKLPHEEQVNFDAIRQEATLWEAASGHPNVLPIIDADVYDNQVVIVSEYADGGSLHDRLKREGKLGTKESIEMTIGILNGLEFLHSRKIIHRDIKPQNILLQGNMPRLADFGISRAMNTTMISSAIIGTDAYMSPESFDGKRNVQTDIWSVGVVLYQLLKGSLPFPQEHPSERMFAVLTKDFEPLSDELPADLKRIVEKSLAKLPENRYRTTSEMRDELLKAHVPLAHPTLAKTEVLRFPIEQKSIDNTETEKETIDNNIPMPLYAPAPTLPAMPSDSIATQIAQTPVAANPQSFDDYLAHKVAVQDGVAANNPQVLSATPSNTRAKNPLAKFVAGSIGGIILLIILIGIYAVTRSGSASLESFKDSTGKYGFKNLSGKVVVQPKYDYVIPFQEGLSSVGLNGKYGFIDETGKEVIPLKYDGADLFTEGLARVKLNGKEGFIDKNDNVVISFKYEYVRWFSEGYALVMLDGKYGYIDKKGIEVIPIKYDYLSGGKSFDGSYAEMIRNGRKLRVDKYGNETDIGAANNTNTNPNVSTYNTPAANANPAR